MPDLAHLREVAEKATPGRWRWTIDVREMYRKRIIVKQALATDSTGPNRPGVLFYTGEEISSGNADFIATFDPPTVLKLLAALETMEALVSSAELGILGLHVGPLKAGIWKDARKDLAALAEEQE